MKIFVLVCCLTMSLAGLTVTAHSQNSAIYVVKSANCPGLDGTQERVQTGFRMSGTEGVVTALHGVYECRNVVAYVVGSATIDVAIELMDADRDVAVLKRADGRPFADGGLTVGKSSIKATLIGHPLDLSSRQLKSGISLRDAKPIGLEYLVPSAEHAAFNLRGSPLLKTEVFSLEGAVTAGHSGAPIFNSKGEVFAIANGGLERGASEIAWGVPISGLQLIRGHVAPADRNLTARSQLLYSVLAPRGGTPKATACFGRSLVYMRSVGVGALIDSVDDRLTLSQLSFALQADELEGIMDVYRTSDFAASIVVPRGWGLKQVDGEGCVATSPSGQGVNVQYALLALTTEPGGAVDRANTVLIPWESRQFCGDQYVVDPALSNLAARHNLRRGVASLRKSYVKIDFRCGHPGLGYDLPSLMSKWKILQQPVYVPSGMQQCTVQCPVGLMLFPTAIAGAAAVQPEFFWNLTSGSGFASMLTSAKDVLVSSVRLDGNHNREINECLLHMSSSAECQNSYAKQTEWARAVLSAAASQLTPTWN